MEKLARKFLFSKIEQKKDFKNFTCYTQEYIDKWRGDIRVFSSATYNNNFVCGQLHRPKPMLTNLKFVQIAMLIKAHFHPVFFLQFGQKHKNMILLEDARQMATSSCVLPSCHLKFVQCLYFFVFSGWQIGASVTTLLVGVPSCHLSLCNVCAAFLFFIFSLADA